MCPALGRFPDPCSCYKVWVLGPPHRAGGETEAQEQLWQDQNSGLLSHGLMPRGTQSPTLPPSLCVSSYKVRLAGGPSIRSSTWGCFPQPPVGGAAGCKWPGPLLSGEPRASQGL